MDRRGLMTSRTCGGPFDSDGWREHDPLVNAEKLRGTQIYMSTGSGLPGFPNDTPANPRIQDGRAAMFDQIVVGSPIELATNLCTSNMAKRLYELNIPAVVDFRPTGHPLVGILARRPAQVLAVYCSVTRFLIPSDSLVGKSRRGNHLMHCARKIFMRSSQIMLATLSACVLLLGTSGAASAGPREPSPGFSAMGGIT